MVAKQPVDGDVRLSTARPVESVEGTAKQAIYISPGKFFLPEPVNVENVLFIFTKQNNQKKSDNAGLLNEPWS